MKESIKIQKGIAW